MDARWLKLNDAAAYASLGQHRLKELATKRIIRGFQDPDSKRKDWIFDRESLDSYRLRQAGDGPTIEEKILALKARARL